MSVTDIALTALDGDLAILNGDFTVIASDQQHIHDIILDYPGYWKQFLNVGVGLESYQNGEYVQTLRAAIISQLKMDGYTVKNPIIKYDPATDTMNIEPNATRQ